MSFTPWVTQGIGGDLISWQVLRQLTKLWVSENSPEEVSLEKSASTLWSLACWRGWVFQRWACRSRPGKQQWSWRRSGRWQVNMGKEAGLCSEACSLVLPAPRNLLLPFPPSEKPGRMQVCCEAITHEKVWHVAGVQYCQSTSFLNILKALQGKSFPASCLHQAK